MSRERDCPECGQVDVTLGGTEIVDHDRPDGRECSVSDMDWRSFADESLQIAHEMTGNPGAERECVQLRAERDQAVALLREAREYIADEWSENCTIVHRIDGLLDDEGQAHG